MSIREFISKHIILPANDFATGGCIYSHLKFLERSQFWSENEIAQYQNEKLRKLICHAYLNVPFYTDLFNDLRIKPEDIQSKKDLKKLPVLTKADLKKNASKLIAKNINKRNLIYSSSSGSTGEPFQFYTTKYADSFLKAAAIRSWFWMGYHLGDKYVKVSMNPRASFIKKLQDKFNYSLYLSSTQLKEEVFTDFISQMESYDPKFIRCYPLPLYFLSQQIKRSGGIYKGKSLSAINTTGSTLTDEVRNEVEKIFGVKIFDSYSCEGGTMFAQCMEQMNYHPAEEYAISEFLSDGFTKAHQEAPMRHITTDLQNWASPFIRYDTEDYLVLGQNEKCKCGRNFMNVKKILGRDSDVLITPSGKYLIVENFVAYFEWIKEVEQIQVVQDEINHIVINMVVNEKYCKEVQDKLQVYWNNYIGNDVNVELAVVNEIKLTPTGKRRTLIRNSKIKLHV